MFMAPHDVMTSYHDVISKYAKVDVTIIRQNADNVQTPQKVFPVVDIENNNKKMIMLSRYHHTFTAYKCLYSTIENVMTYIVVNCYIKSHPLFAFQR